jgi:soluble lytic murein transglycosylase-like protein
MFARRVCALAALLIYPAACLAQDGPRGRYDDLIARLAKSHGVPEDLVHRVVKRESRYNPSLVHRQCYGLMQIKPATARGMGYKGPANRLLDPEVNLTYGVPYLANAYRLADSDESRAIALYSGGYYYVAKRRNMLGALRTASSSPEPSAAPAPPPEPQNPLAQAFSFLAGPNPAGQSLVADGGNSASQAPRP